LELSDFIENGHYYLGEAYLANGEKEKACEHFREALRSNDITNAELAERCRQSRVDAP
jgi:hypothetical protein